MKVQITYVETSKESTAQAEESLQSFLSYGWSATLNKGITPSTLNDNDFDVHDLLGGRLESFKQNESQKYPIKKSCLFNNLKFAESVIEADQPMIFAEHDALCIDSYTGWDFDEFCFLAIDYAFAPPTALSKPPYNSYRFPPSFGVVDFPSNYPLIYYKDSVYNGSMMTPGTAAYALSPKGAKKLLYAATSLGLEQSDFIINSYNLRLQYITPSPVKYNSVNLNMSHTL